MRQLIRYYIAGSPTRAVKREEKAVRDMAATSAIEARLQSRAGARRIRPIARPIWRGMEIRELLGQRDLSFAEATRILGARLGRPQLGYVQLPYADMAGLLQEAGFSECLAGLYVEMAQAINEGQVGSREGRRPSNTTATSFEAFVDKVINGTSCSLAPAE